MSPKISPKTVLITGCTDNSIGSGLSKAFAARGLRVFAAARSTSSMSSLAAVPNVTLLELDVTSPESIAAAVKTISSETGGTLDYLFNNAGVVYRSAAVETDDRMARRLFDVNFWGVVDMCRAFAHLVVEAKGTIINHGSLNARVSLPWSCEFSPLPGSL
jgi:NAD(P)-dependent dehydrogenase (short-subunit alcohol dehydrogenase family)